MAAYTGRPFKVWNADRSVKKSLMAANLQELIDKGCVKLGMSNTSRNVRVLLEGDGTEVDEEDYFSFLNSDATLILLTPSQKWRPAGLERPSGSDETDAAADTAGISQHTKQLLCSLKQDVTRIITFSDEDLQSLVEVSGPALAEELGETERYAAAVRDACQRHLDERAATKEAVDLLRLYHQARKVSPYVDAADEAGGSKKRPHSPEPDQS